MKDFLKNNLNIIITLVAVFLVAGLGSLFVNMGLEWLEELNKPSEWIPNFVIPIVWSIIYLSFAIIFSILLKQKLVSKKLIILSIVNGILNILWCLVFFTLNQLLLGNILIILNAFFGVLLLIEMIKTNKLYVNLLWIYPFWLFVATTLNLSLWILN